MDSARPANNRNENSGGPVRPAPPVEGGHARYPPPNLRSIRSPLLLLAVALMALAVFLTAGAPPAAANPEVTLVSNTGQQPHNLDQHFDDNIYAQGFTTGPAGDGYMLTSIEVDLQIKAGITSSDAATVRGEVWSDSNGTPGSKIVDMAARNVPTGTSLTEAGTFGPRWTTRLAANTTYHFVIYTAGGLDALALWFTRSMADDAGAANGWSVSDASSRLAQNTPAGTPSWDSRTNAVVQIAVKGYQVSTPHWTATLSVKDLGHLGGDGCTFTSGKPQCSAQLSPSVITYEGVNYNVLAIKINYSGTLQFLLDKELPHVLQQGMNLNIGGKRYFAKDALESWGIEGNENAWWLNWTGTGLDWSDGDTISLTLDRTIGGL